MLFFIFIFLFLQPGLLLPHCRVIQHFIELTDGTKEDGKEKTLKSHPPTSFQDSPHRTLRALLGVSQSSCGHKTPCPDSGLLPQTASLRFLALNYNNSPQLPFPMKKTGSSFAKSSKMYLVLLPYKLEAI